MNDNSACRRTLQEKCNNVTTASRIENVTVASSSRTEIMIEANQTDLEQMVLQPADHVGSVIEENHFVGDRALLQNTRHRALTAGIVLEDGDSHADPRF